mgnify:CR=1 FL=1
MTAHKAYNSPATIVELTGADQQITSSSAVLLGADVNDDASGNVHLHIYHGTANTDPLILGMKPANGEHKMVWLGPNGIACPNGIYVDVESGTPEGSIFIRT